MGVAGLWDIVSKAGQSRSLAYLAVVDGFDSNRSGKRAYRVGIDASIWYTHAAFSKGGDNPQLRMLFFRIRSLAELPILPLFVFDGRERPKEKRGSKMGKSGSHNLTADMKKLLDVFGMEWRMALGEAEAELAYLNHIGVIDAIMTDDVDALIFGAQVIIKNVSANLSGNRSKPALNSDGKASKHHVMVYTASQVETHPEIGLSRPDLVFFALLAGGDYDKGVPGFGKAIAHGLARCGFGAQLLMAYGRREHQDLRNFLIQWRKDINQELRTNSRRFLPHKCPSLSIPLDFPNIEILANYANPVSSAQSDRGGGGGHMRDTGDLNIPGIAALCEQKFSEWGHESAIIKRFRDVMWEAAVCSILRRAALEADRHEQETRIAQGEQDVSIRGAFVPSRADAIGTPASLVKKHLSALDIDRRREEAFVNRGSIAAAPVNRGEATNSLIRKVVGSRKHVSTDKMLEYRVEVAPKQLVALARSGIKGTRSEPSLSQARGSEGAMADELFDAILAGSAKSPKKPAPDPDSLMRIWVPASILRQVHPDLVEDYESSVQAKRSGGGKGKGKAPTRESDEEEDEVPMRRQVSPSPRHPRVPAPFDADRGEGSSSMGTQPRSQPTRELSTSLDITADEVTGQLRNPTHFLYWIPHPDAYDLSAPDADGDYAISRDSDEETTIGHDTSGSTTGTATAQPVASTTINRPFTRPAAGPSSQSYPSAGEISARLKSAQDAVPLFLPEDDETDEDETLPPSRFDHLFDQAMGFAPPKPKTKHPPRKRPRTSEPFGSEPVTVRSGVKRRKTAVVAAVAIDLSSDEEDARAIATSSRRRRIYPSEPTSSQVSSVDDIIDLT